MLALTRRPCLRSVLAALAAVAVLAAPVQGLAHCVTLQATAAATDATDGHAGHHGAHDEHAPVGGDGPSPASSLPCADLMGCAAVACVPAITALAFGQLPSADDMRAVLERPSGQLPAVEPPPKRG